MKKKKRNVYYYANCDRYFLLSVHRDKVYIQSLLTSVSWSSESRSCQLSEYGEKSDMRGSAQRQPSKRKLRSLNMQPEVGDDSLSEMSDGTNNHVKPAWWEMAVFRFLNAIMVVFFLTAVVKLQSDDNACLWVPTFLVPAFLSTIVAVKPQLSGCKTGSSPDAIQSVIQYKCDRRTLLEMQSRININPINTVSFSPHQIFWVSLLPSL